MKLSRLELRRQLFHLLFGIFLVLLIHFDLINLKLIIVVLLAGLLTSMVCRHHDVPIISWFLSKFDRPGVRFPGEGAFFLIMGTAVVLAIFPKQIALASLMIMVFGDSFAAIIGRSIGKRRFAHKTLEGTLAGITFGFLGALFFVSPITALLGSGVAMFFEAFDFKFYGSKVDDNLFIPVVSSIIMYVWMIL